MEAGVLGQHFAGPGVALDLGGLAHVAVHHDDLALAVKPLGNILHRKLCRLLVARADERRGGGLGLGVDIHDRNARRQGFVDRRRASLDLARVEDNRVHVLGDEALDLLNLFLGAPLGVVDDELDVQLFRPLLHCLIDHHDELVREIHQRNADHWAMLAGRGLRRGRRAIAADNRGSEESEGVYGRRAGAMAQSPSAFGMRRFIAAFCGGVVE